VNATQKPAVDEETRAYLQARISIYAMLVLFSIVADLTLLTTSYALFPTIKPGNANAIAGAGTIGLVVLAVFWRAVLVRRVLSIRTLHLIDAAVAVILGTFLAAGAYFAYDLRPASYTAATLAYGLVFTRALVVPSSGTRTAVVTAMLFTPLMAASVGLAVRVDQEVPPEMFIGGAFVFGVVAVALAAVGSSIIYGLRKRVSEAMQLGKYTLDRKIGEGGMGAVYRARHAVLRRPAAIKLLLPDRVAKENLERFEREVQHMSQLTHPNTVAVFDYGHNPDGVFYYAMEYLDGIDLEQLVGKYGEQPAARVVSILAQICGALAEAHGRNIIHRDIKPANVILCERGGMPDVAKVVDFGLVKEITANTGTSTQVILGTPAYVAPEAITDPNTVGPPADIYAVGAIGYFLLTAKRVFWGKTAIDVCVQHVTAPPTPPSKQTTNAIPDELEQLILRCLAKQPSARPTAAELLRLLQPPPPSAGWSEADAAKWWSEFREHGDHSPSMSTPTMTITIDLGHRE
jgi:hypothetical protein